MELQLSLFKRCRKCGKLKPLSDFYFEDKAKTKLKPICKRCVVERVVDYQKRNWSKHKAYKRELYARNIFRERMRKPQNQVDAHYAVHKAMREKRLIKPERCESCGRSGKLEAHHYAGYKPEDWLKIVWLCSECHGAVHVRTE